MKKSLFGAITVALFLSSCHDPDPFHQGADSRMARRMQNELDDYVTGSAEVPGAWLSVTIDEKYTELVSGYGNIVSFEPLSVASEFRISSITKMFTSVVIFQMVEEGSIDLSDPIFEILGRQLLTGLQTDEAIDRITVKDLLRHTSGIEDYVALNWTTTLLTDPLRFWKPQDLLDYVKENGMARFEPGTGYYYSDTNYVLLGLIIEKLLNKPIHKAYEDRILQPLKMDHTYMEAYASGDNHQLASGYFKNNDLSHWNTSSDWSGGGLVSTLADLSVFMKALTKGQFVW